MSTFSMRKAGWPSPVPRDDGGGRHRCAVGDGRLRSPALGHRRLSRLHRPVPAPDTVVLFRDHQDLADRDL